MTAQQEPLLLDGFSLFFSFFLGEIMKKLAMAFVMALPLVAHAMNERRVCTTGKPCGNTCINVNYTCNLAPSPQPVGGTGVTGPSTGVGFLGGGDTPTTPTLPLIVSPSPSSETANIKNLSLKKAVYEYGQMLAPSTRYGMSEYRIESRHCNVAQIIVQVTQGTVELGFIETGDPADETITRYKDFITPESGAFAYNLFSSHPRKAFLLFNPLGDKEAVFTAFGYCISTDSAASLVVDDALSGEQSP
jgi:hypothetical protein